MVSNPPVLLAIFRRRLSLGAPDEGLGVTFQITAISMTLMLVIGLTTALLRMSNSWAGKAVARVYMELIRNSPLLIQIFFIYFVVAPIIDMSGFWAAVVALSLFEGGLCFGNNPRRY